MDKQYKQELLSFLQEINETYFCEYYVEKGNERYILTLDKGGWIFRHQNKSLGVGYCKTDIGARIRAARRGYAVITK